MKTSAESMLSLESTTPTQTLQFSPNKLRRRPREIVRVWALVPPPTREKIISVLSGQQPWPLVFIGPAGTGKTCTALAVIDGVYGDAPYTSAAKMLTDLISAGNGELCDSRGDKISVQRWWREWSEASITILDELGAREKISDYQYENVKRAIDDRAGKPAIYISNAELPQLEKLYDDRISSRLAAGTVIVMGGKDRRLEKRIAR